MRIRITKVPPICPAPKVGEEYEVNFTDEQLPEFGGGERYHITCMGKDVVVCEYECEVINDLGE